MNFKIGDRVRVVNSFFGLIPGNAGVVTGTDDKGGPIIDWDLSYRNPAYINPENVELTKVCLKSNC